MLKVRSEILDLEKEIEKARQSVEVEMLRTYERVKKVVSRAPYMAPLKDQNARVVILGYLTMLFQLH